MASHQTLEETVRNGANLVLQSSPPEDLMRQLIQLALESGAHLTVPNTFSDDFTTELLKTAPKQITFVEAAKQMATGAEEA